MNRKGKKVYKIKNIRNDKEISCFKIERWIFLSFIFFIFFQNNPCYNKKS